MPQDSVESLRDKVDFKGKISPILYVAGIGLVSLVVDAGNRILPIAESNHAETRNAFGSGKCARRRLSVAIYVLVAAMWLIPDRRIENMLREK